MIVAYCREYGIWYLIYALMAGLFGLQFYLYGLPLVYFFYSLSLVTLVLLLFSIWLFWRFRGKMLALTSGSDQDLAALLLPSEKAFVNRLAEEAQQFRKEQASLKERDKRLQTIVKMWAHQIKVPQAALSLMAQTDQLTPQEVLIQLHQLDKQLSNLLNYLKLSDHQLDFRFELVDVRQVVIELVKAYRIQFNKQGIGVAIRGDYQLKTDRKWLQFALAQLLDNALKYNRPGGQVTIDLADGITITDTGIGILPEDLPRLFEEGFTGYNGREHQKATGFGLYLTKTVLDQLGLIAQVSSQLDVGTSVRVQKAAEEGLNPPLTTE